MRTGRVEISTTAITNTILKSEQKKNIIRFILFTILLTEINLIKTLDLFSPPVPLYQTTSQEFRDLIPTKPLLRNVKVHFRSLTTSNSKDNLANSTKAAT